MDEYYILTFVKNGVDIDLTKLKNLTEIEFAAIDQKMFLDIENIAKKEQIKILGVEPYNMIKFKAKIIEDFIEKSK